MLLPLCHQGTGCAEGSALRKTPLFTTSSSSESLYSLWLKPKAGGDQASIIFCINVIGSSSLGENFFRLPDDLSILLLFWKHLRHCVDGIVTYQFVSCRIVGISSSSSFPQSGSSMIFWVTLASLIMYCPCGSVDIPSSSTNRLSSNELSDTLFVLMVCNWCIREPILMLMVL